MIIDGGARKNGKFFSVHLAKTEDNERVTVLEYKNLCSDTITDAFREMKSVAKATRAENYFYHASMNPREDEVLTPEQWEIAIDRLEANLGLTDHARFQVEHVKEGREHRHIIWSRVDADTMTVVPAKNDYYIHMATARELEKEFGHQATPDLSIGHRTEKTVQDWELFRAQESKIDPHQVAAEVTALYRQSDNGVAFVSGLEEAGYVLANGHRGYNIIDSYGDSHSLVRRLDGVKTAELRNYLADVPLESLPSVAEAAAIVRERNRQDETSGSSDVRVLPEEQAERNKISEGFGGIDNSIPPDPSFNPKLAILEKYAAEHHQKPDTYPAATSAEDMAQQLKQLVTHSQDEHPVTSWTWQDFADQTWKKQHERTEQEEVSHSVETVYDLLTDTSPDGTETTYWRDYLSKHDPPEQQDHELER